MRDAMKRLGFTLALVLVLLPGDGAVAATAAQFDVVMRAYLADFARESPVYADSLGIQTYADRLDDLSVAGHARGLASLRAWRARFADEAPSSAEPAGVAADRLAMIHALDAQLVEDELRIERVDHRQTIGGDAGGFRRGRGLLRAPRAPGAQRREPARVSRHRESGVRRLARDPDVRRPAGR